MIIVAPMRNTRQRRVILEELVKLRSHPTAEELHRIVRRRIPRISLATVYRNLEEMADRGIIRKIGTGTGPRRFDADTSEHFHALCHRCGRVADIETDDHCLDLARELRRLCDTDFSVREVNIELIGLCPECRNELEAESASASGETQV